MKRPNKRIFGKFTQEWRDWWTSIQPQDRKLVSEQQGVGLAHDKLNATAWKLLSKSGPAGLYNVVLGLTLCFPSFKTDCSSVGIMTLSQWHSYVYDVAWVFEQILSEPHAVKV